MSLKRVLLTISLGLSVAAQAHVGETIEQAKKEYGPVKKTEPAWCGGTAYGFQPTPTTYVYAIVVPGETTIADIMYVKFKGTGTWSVPEKEALWNLNKDPRITGYTRFFKFHGRESLFNKDFKKFVWTERNSSGKLVLYSNDFKECESKPGSPDSDNGWHGVQFRNEAAMDLERACVQKAVRDYQEKSLQYTILKIQEGQEKIQSTAKASNP